LPQFLRVLVSSASANTVLSTVAMTKKIKQGGSISYVDDLHRLSPHVLAFADDPIRKSSSRS